MTAFLKIGQVAYGRVLLLPLTFHQETVILLYINPNSGAYYVIYLIAKSLSLSDACHRTAHQAKLLTSRLTMIIGRHHASGNSWSDVLGTLTSSEYMLIMLSTLVEQSTKLASCQVNIICNQPV